MMKNIIGQLEPRKKPSSVYPKECRWEQRKISSEKEGSYQERRRFDQEEAQNLEILKDRNQQGDESSLKLGFFNGLVDNIHSSSGRAMQTLIDEIKYLNNNKGNQFQFMRRGIVGSYKDELTVDEIYKIDSWSEQILKQAGVRNEEIFKV
uniref:Uncharacterized protein n=1 Tax=Megaselia scalaris TaxID=36166 RepID=T1GXK2_MEGSC